ncbi:hypothetical protein ACTXT7_010654 [Hymenolepis weldensis]
MSTDALFFPPSFSCCSVLFSPLVDSNCTIDICLTQLSYCSASCSINRKHKSALSNESYSATSDVKV